MKQVLIIIRPNFYYQTKDALIEQHFYAMSSKDVVGRGKTAIQRSAKEEGPEVDSVYSDNMIAKKMIEIYVRDEDLDRLVETISKVNRHNKAGDGKIFVVPVEDSIRIHTGENGDNALV